MKNPIPPLQKYRDDKWWWCLPYELINIGKILNFSIQENTQKIFFLNNSEILYLYNKKNELYESPIIGYYSGYYEKIYYYSIFWNGQTESSIILH